MEKTKHHHKGNMKNIHVAILTLTVGLAVTLFADEKQASPATHETFKAEVLKVFSATDSNAVFRAYLVKWKGQEVIVSDPLVASDHRVGDTVSVIAINQPFPRDQAKPRLLNFQMLPGPNR